MTLSNGLIYFIKQRIGIRRFTKLCKRMVKRTCRHYTARLITELEKSNWSTQYSLKNFIENHMNDMKNMKCSACGEGSAFRYLLLFGETYSVCSTNCLVALAERKRTEYIEEYGADKTCSLPIELVDKDFLCESCGTLNPENSIFCKGCGVLLQTDEESLHSYSHITTVKILSDDHLCEEGG